ncbi:hypothetical protein FSP39_004057 [Pinctada imbricata]|uniref:Ubiquitin carboxyl-terminal hydrolase n=1 Tax=Pinctada imbricata TaxID=66713 RepID=A0AA88YHH3_PINIB|nr:hypothetical protein FSP39_004057 [Pinctada imbricata]
MESCKHLSKIKKWNHSILDPQKWMCYVCGTTESVWACLSCPNVACGRYNEEHALKHFKERQHPLCIEVNEKYVYCYECDDYVLNDNAAGDLKILRSALSAIATQSFSDVESRGRRLLRSYSHTTVTSPQKSDEDDKLATAEFHRRTCILRKVFTAWKLCVHLHKGGQVMNTPKKEKSEALSDSPSLSPSNSFLKRRTIIPGVTGLRNLGNTCYMNSVLQVLSHLESFREFFMKRTESCSDRVMTPESSPQSSSLYYTPKSSLKPHKSFQSPIISPGMSPVSHRLPEIPSCISDSQTSTPRSTRYLSRQSTMECFQHLMTPVSSKKSLTYGGLNGGSTAKSLLKKRLICSVEERETTHSYESLCEEVNGLFRVLWSGRWAQVSPHAFLRAVWQKIPTFKGHAQHDAQEFLCELLDKVQNELECLVNSEVDIINQLFKGQLVSQVKCLECNNISERTEPFMDLSLEFPERYQITLDNPRAAQDICHVTEMLHTFTEIEKLDGKIYKCEKCNGIWSQSKSPKVPVYSYAQKQFLLGDMPPVLRLHLKRFRWSGRLHREKISTQVGIDEILDMTPFCVNPDPGGSVYHLMGVIVHHGRGFGCGHYTAYCWNSEAESWVHCNDSRMKFCTLDEVLQCQCYILVYKRSQGQTTPTSDSPDCDMKLSFNRSQGSFSQKIDDDITFNFKTPPTIAATNRKKRLSDHLSETDRIIKRRRSTLW